MEENHSLQRQHSGIWRSLRDGDFEEEEVWAVLKDKPESNNSSSGIFKPKDSFSSSSSLPLSVARPLPSASRMIPKASSSNSIVSNNNNYSSIEAKVLQQSAPVNIPDWSKIYSNNKKQKKVPSKRISRFGDYDFDEDGVINDGDDTDEDEAEDEEEEEEDDEFDYKLPPHEFIARRQARSQISSFSVFEGIGRTLKGRDLSKVRNAVLTKTGFLESL